MADADAYALASPVRGEDVLSVPRAIHPPVDPVIPLESVDVAMYFTLKGFLELCRLYSKSKGFRYINQQSTIKL